MAPILKFAASSGSKKKEPKYVCQKRSLKVPGNGAPPPPPCYPNRVSMKRDAPSLEPIYVYLSESPKRSPPTKCGENIVPVHGDPRGRKAYIKWRAAWFPKGTVNDTAIAIPVPCSFSTIPSPDHPPFLGRPEPR